MGESDSRNSHARTPGDEALLARLSSDDWGLRTEAARDARIARTPAALPLLVDTLREGFFRRKNAPKEPLATVRQLFKTFVEYLLPALSTELFSLGAGYVALSGITIFVLLGMGKILEAVGLSIGHRLIEVSLGSGVFWFWLGVFSLVPVASVWEGTRVRYEYFLVRALNPRGARDVFVCGLVVVAASLAIIGLFITDSFFALYLILVLFAFCTGLFFRIFQDRLKCHDESVYGNYYPGQALYGLHALAAVSEITETVEETAPCHVCPTCFTRITSYEDPDIRVSYFRCRRCDCVYNGQREWKDVKRIVAVLRRDSKDLAVQEGSTLYVDYQLQQTAEPPMDAGTGAYRNLTRLFDMDQIEIRDASDSDVEEFVTRLLDDSENSRRGQYAHVLCTVAEKSSLDTSTISLLRDVFKQLVLE